VPPGGEVTKAEAQGSCSSTATPATAENCPGRSVEKA